MREDDERERRGREREGEDEYRKLQNQPYLENPTSGLLTEGIYKINPSS
jgi:hypothetical protein